MINICFNLFLVLIHICGEGKYLFQFDPFRRWCTGCWWQNNLFARTVRSRSNFLASPGESFGWEPIICAPRLLCLYSCVCLCCTLCFVFTHHMCSSPSLSLSLLLPFLCLPTICAPHLICLCCCFCLCCSLCFVFTHHMAPHLLCLFCVFTHVLLISCHRAAGWTIF